MAAAAYQVLLARHPEQAGMVADHLFRAAVAATPVGQAADDAVTMGAAIGLAVVNRYRASGNPPMPFPVSNEPGRWRATPPFRLVALVGDSKPFLFDDTGTLRGPPPPVLGSPHYLEVVDEVRRLGDDRSRERTADQTAAAEFWASQSSQRGYLHLAIRLMAEHPLPGGIWDEARGMAQLTMALADGYVMAWELKRQFGYWRPITAINEGGFGVTPDPRWYPLLPTPPHPDYPSGHATDCAVGAAVLQGIFGERVGAVRYAAVDLQGQPTRDYPSLTASADECAASRVWAGAHFRPANDEGLRIGRAIAVKALEALPPLPGTPAR
jgi:PAP2 superfamily